MAHQPPSIIRTEVTHRLPSWHFVSYGSGDREWTEDGVEIGDLNCIDRALYVLERDWDAKHFAHAELSAVKIGTAWLDREGVIAFCDSDGNGRKWVQAAEARVLERINEIPAWEWSAA